MSCALCFTLTALPLHHKIALAFFPQVMSKHFSRRLIWRDLAYWQLFHWPNMASEPVRAHYIDMEWSSGEEAERHLKAWQQGKTGMYCTEIPVLAAAISVLSRLNKQCWNVRDAIS